MTAFRCDEHEDGIRGLEVRVAKIEYDRGSRWVPVFVAAVTALGGIGAAGTLAWTELQKLRASLPQTAERDRQQLLADALQLVQDRSQQRYEQGRKDGIAEGRAAQLHDVLEAQRPATTAKR